MIIPNANFTKNRVMSGRPSSVYKPRPQTSTSGKTSGLQTQFNITQQYNNPVPIRKTSRSYMLSNQKTLKNQRQKTKKDNTIVSIKDKQELYLENITLKKQVNKAHQEYSILKGKVQASRKRNTRRSQPLQLQFQKQLYWTGTKTHLISGIKCQYQKLKREYAQKHQQNEQLRREIVKTNVPELKIYIDNLQVENNRLQKRISKLQIQQNITGKTNQQKRVTQYLLLQKEQKQIRLQFQLKQTKEKLEKQKLSLEQKDKKIIFLQKLIKDKQNREFQANQKTRRLQKQKQCVIQQRQQLQEKINTLKKDAKQNIQIIQQKYQQQIQSIKQNYENIIKQKQIQIASHQQRIQYLQLNLDNLQMQMGHQKFESIQKQLSNQSNTSKRVTKRSSHIQFMNSSFNFQQFLQQMVEQDQKSPIIIQQQKSFNGDRVQKTADKKHSQNSKKLRRVQVLQIQNIAQFLKYKMIQAKVDVKKVKNYFDFVLQQDDQISSESGQKQKLWDYQYINMKQTIQILQSEPFGLSDDDATLLARYIIEDAQGQYIYCDIQNQQKREVVKSIMKTLLDEYDVPNQQTQHEYQDLMLKYGPNILSALKTICPSGNVSKRKYVQLLNGLGIQTSNTLLQFIIGKLAVHSKNLIHLNYTPVFKQVKQQ